MRIQRETLSHKVAHHLRTRILSGQYAKGSHLSETHLSKQLEVSRGPIREAIMLLEKEGLTETPLNGRTVVKGMTVEDVSDLFEVRLALESLAVRNIIQRGKYRDLHSLRRIQQQMEQTESRSEMIRLDIELHEQLVQLSNNRIANSMFSLLKGVIATLIEITTGTYDRQQQLVTSHADMIRVLEQGDAEQCIALLTAHLQAGESIIIDYLRASEAGRS